MGQPRKPLYRIGNFYREVAGDDYLPAALVQSHGQPVDIVPWQAVALQTAVLADGVTSLITANQFTYQSSWATGRTVQLEIIGGASLLGGGCAASLLDAGGGTVATVTAVSTVANGISTARSQPLTLIDGAVYRPAFRAVPASSGVTLNLTASLRLLRLVFV